MAQDTGQGAQGDGTEQPAADAPTTSDAATKAPRGSVEVEKVGYASELVAYRVIDKLADTIASDVWEALKGYDGTPRVLLVDGELGPATLPEASTALQAALRRF